MLASKKKESLKNDIILSTLSYEEIFQRYIVDGGSYFFTDFLDDAANEYKTKSLISEYLGVHIHEIIFVGSAKLGFSLNPKNLFNEFDSKFQKTKINRDKSDIDVAIVSEQLFNSISTSIFDYTDAFRNKWNQNEYYFGDKLRNFTVPVCYKYFEYFSKGWFRPDMKPQGFDFCVKDSYEDLKKYFYAKFRRKIGLGIYKNWHFFKYYHMRNLENLSYLVKTETI